MVKGKEMEGTKREGKEGKEE